ncbi:hypothetical protein C8R46DRAFT_1219432 [Mycena filopes]|nr:hypothetical protein C8R46DRAFT_1219432 [Mycena filopes]
MNNALPGLNFIIIGASIAGLASAIALKASGNNVLVLEKEPELGRADSMSGCARVPPNGCKILTDWGLEDEINATISDTAGLFAIYKYEGGLGADNYIGMHRFDPELIRDSRGHFTQFRHHDLLRILYDELLKKKPGKSTPDVKVIFGAEVVEVDCDAAAVLLTSGEIHTADAIIGADGPTGVVRRTLMEEEGVTADGYATATGLALYSALIPVERVANDPELTMYHKFPKNNVLTGSNRAGMAFSTGKRNDVTLFVYTPDDPPEDNALPGGWSKNAKRRLSEVVGPAAPYVKKLAGLADSAICVPIHNHYQLESWVSESGKVLALGEAAHPFPPSSFHTYSIALEDGAFIGKIFSHTRDPDRIPEFLNAFQEHRGPRCARIMEMETQLIDTITFEDGEAQEQRDAFMRAQHAKGLNVLDVPGSDLSEMHNDWRIVFDYDPADDADEWWITWGRYRDRDSKLPGAAEMEQGFIDWGSSFSSASVTVSYGDS